MTFNKYMKMQRFINNPDMFKEGEEVLVTEKVHGSNVRFLTDLDGKFYAGTRSTVLGDVNCQTNWQTKFQFLLAKYPMEKLTGAFPNITLYCELFGPGIQGAAFTYNRKEPELMLFDAYDATNNRWLPAENLIAIANMGGLWLAPGVYAGPWDKDLILSLAEDPSFFGDNQLREGVVIRSRPETTYINQKGEVGRKIVKYHNPSFDKAKNGVKADDI